MKQKVLLDGIPAEIKLEESRGVVITMHYSDIEKHRQLRRAFMDIFGNCIHNSEYITVLSYEESIEKTIMLLLKNNISVKMEREGMIYG